MGKKKLLLLFLISLFTISFISAAVIEVPTNYVTIQEAIDAAFDGDIIQVDDGTYTEQLTITDKGLTIIGESEAGVIIQADTTAPSSNNVFNIDAVGKDITLEYMTIRNGKYGIRSKEGNVNVLHSTLYHNGWDGTGVDGSPTQGEMATLWDSSSTADGGAIRIEDSANSELAHLTVYENVRSIRYQDGDNGDIHDNVAYNNLESGIYLSSSDYTSANGCTNTEVYENEVYGNMNNGLLSIGGKNNEFYDNNVYDNWNTGVMLWHVGENTIQNNIIDNNGLYDFNGIGNSGDDEAGGIWMVNNGVYAGSTFIAKILDNTISNNQEGELVDTVGIHVDSTMTSDGIEIIGNTFVNHDIDIWVEAEADSITVNYNSFDGTGIGVQNDDDEELDAKDNFWGACDGPSTVGFGSGDKVSTNVDFDPWLGICLENKTENDCSFVTNNVTISADVEGPYLEDVWFSYIIDGTDYNKTAIKNGENNYSYNIPASELVASQNVQWNIYATDEKGITYSNGLQTFYVRNETYLGVDPFPADGLNNWFITEPEFSMLPDSTAVNRFYQWAGGSNILYSNIFGLENIPNADPKESAGTLELNWWTEFAGTCNESTQTQMFYVDLTDPVIKDLEPEDGEEIINNRKPTISALLSEVYQSNSGIDKNSILMKVNDLEVNPTIVSNGIGATITYNPTTYLPLGTNNVSVYVKDKAGRESTSTWTFDVITLVPEFNLTVNAPETGLSSSRRIPFNISLTKDVTLQYINYNDFRPTWRTLCTRCDEYGLERTRTRTLREGVNNIGIRATDLYSQTKEESFVITIDSRKPRVSRTEPRRGSYVDDDTIFKVRYTEDNVQKVELFWGDGSISKVLTGCESGSNKECSTTTVLGHEGQTIDYWFEVSDSINTISSRKTSVKVDTVSPILTINEPINDVTFRRRVPFNLSVTEDVTLEYKDIFDSRPRWRRLCSRCDEYGLNRNRERSFRQGTHDLEIRAIDKAGNSDTESVGFTINYFS